MSDRIEAEILDVLGEEVDAAVDTPLVVIEGPKGDPGAPGKDGHSPVVTATKSGKTTTISVDGAAIATVEDGADGKPGAAGSDGITPTIGDSGNWYLGEEDTGKPSRGEKGEKGDTGAAGPRGETGPQGTPGKDGANGKDGKPGEKGADGAPGVYYGTTQPTGDTHPVWIDPDGGPDDGGLLPAVTAADNGKVLRVVSSAWSAEDMPTGGTDMGITGASVGQIAKITAVDDSGKPTAWEAVDMPSGGGGSGETWEEINAITLSDAVNTVTINTDSGGNAIALKKVRILVEGSATHNQDLFLNNSRYFRAIVVGTSPSVGALSAEPFCGKMYCFAVPNIIANYGFSSQAASAFSTEITITEIKLIVNNSGTFSAGTKFTIQGVRA